MNVTRVCDATGWLDFFMKKPKGELLLILYEREKYSSESVAMAEEVLKTKYGLSEKKLHSPSLFTTPALKARKTRDKVLAVLNEMGVDWNFVNRLDGDEEDDNNLSFSYHEDVFSININNRYSDFCISLDFGYTGNEKAKARARWRKAINILNRECMGNIAFDIEEHRFGSYLGVNQLIHCLARPQGQNFMFHLHETLVAMSETKRKFFQIVEKLKQGKRVGKQKRRLRRKSLRVKGDSIENIILPKTVIKMKSTKKTSTRDLFILTLKEMGCPYEVDEDEGGDVCFSFQGATFWASFGNGIPFISVYDYAWASVDLSDLDEVSRARQAINEVNWRVGVSALYEVDVKAQTMYVDSKAVFQFTSNIKELPYYLNFQLNVFFRARHLFGAEMERLRAGVPRVK